jgi:uncharacterized surface protein with fasciclin (FAS1) repeats
MHISRTLVAAVALGALALASFPGSGEAGKNTPKLKSIVQTARDAGNFTTLLAAIDAAGLTGTLSGQGKAPFTVFAPTDEAFAKLPAGTVEALLADPEALKAILLYHVVAGNYPAASVVGMTSLQTVGGGSLAISAADGVTINDANILATDIQARNGVIHVIDTVLIPE